MNWMHWRLPFLSAGYGIDLGTANTVVVSPRRGVILNEPSYMVVRNDPDRKGEPLAIGRAAKDLIGRTPAGLTAIRPLRDGVITDLQTARSFILAIINMSAHHPWQRFRPRAVIGIPAGATGLERRALMEAAEESGIRRVDLLPEPIAGALGSGRDPLAPRAQMVVDIGGGTAEVTVFCYGGILASRSSRVAGDEMTEAVNQWLRQEQKIVVGELTAEQVKVQLHANGSGPAPVMVAGRDMASDRPKQVTLDPSQLQDALKPTVDSILATLGSVVEDLPAQAVGDIMEDGILVFGGGSQLDGFPERIQQAFGFKVQVSERPMTCVAEGAAAALSRPRVLQAFGSSEHF